MENISMMELVEIRSFFQSAFDEMQKMKPGGGLADDSETLAID